MKPIRLIPVVIFFLAACNFNTPPTTQTSPTSPPPSPAPTTPPMSQAGGNADIIFHNGTILTMNRNQPTAEAILIRGDKIEAVGSNADILALRSNTTFLIDLGGLTLMPGFVDAHTHLFKTYWLENTDAVGAQTIALQYGVTTIGELAGDEPHVLFLRDLGRGGQMRLRVNVYPSVYNEGCQGSVFDQDWYKAYPPGAEIAPNVRMAGIKIYTDGSGCVPPAVSFEYAKGAGHGTLFFDSPEKLFDTLKIYYDQGYQIAIHTLGDRAVEQVQQAIAMFPAEAHDFNHFRTEHNAVIRPDLMKGYSELGIAAVLFGGYPTCFTTNRTDEFLYATPDDHLDWEWPWRSLLEANPNGHFAYHSDAFGLTPLNPFEHLMGLTTRREYAEDGSICLPPPLLEQNKIELEQALELMTLGGAFALNQEDRIGSLEPGKLADLIVLSQNPLTTHTETLRETKVYVTVVGGKTEYCAAGYDSLCTSAPPPSSETVEAFRDEFDGALASGWAWLREDSSAWSLNAAPGWLRINVSTGGYLTGLPSNVLTRPAPQGDFEIRTNVRFTPTRNFELAGLIVLFDERTILQFGPAYCSLGSCPGSSLYFDNMQNGTAIGSNFATPGSIGQSLLRLVRTGNRYTAYYQYYQGDNITWIEIGSHIVDRPPLSIGLIAAQVQAAGSYAEFDWFEIAQP